MANPLVRLPLPRSSAVRFSPDGSVVAVSAALMTLVLEVGTGRVVSVLWSGRHACDFTFSSEGRALAIRDFLANSIHVARWDGSTFVEAENWSAVEDAHGLEFSPCGKYLVAGTRTGFEVFDTKNGEVEFEYTTDGHWLEALECTSARDVWLTAQHPAITKQKHDTTAEFRRWTWPFDQATCEVLPYRVPRFHQAALGGRDGDLLAALFSKPGQNDTNGTIQVYSISRRMILHEQPGYPESSSALRWSPCGELLGYGTETGVNILHFESRSIPMSFEIKMADRVDFAPDGQYCAITGHDGLLLHIPWPRTKKSADAKNRVRGKRHL